MITLLVYISYCKDTLPNLWEAPFLWGKRTLIYLLWLYGGDIRDSRSIVHNIIMIKILNAVKFQLEFSKMCKFKSLDAYSLL